MTKFNNEIPTWLEMLTVTARTTVLGGGTRLDCCFKANKKRQQRSLFPARNLGDQEIRSEPRRRTNHRHYVVLERGRRDVSSRAFHPGETMEEEAWAQLLGTDPREISHSLGNHAPNPDDRSWFTGSTVLTCSVKRFLCSYDDASYLPTMSATAIVSCSSGRGGISRRVWFRLNYLLGVVWGMERFYNGFSLAVATRNETRCGWLPDPRGEKRCVTMCQLTWRVTRKFGN